MGDLRFICMDVADAKKVGQFWEAALNGYTMDAQEWGVILTSEAGPGIYLETVPEGKSVKNRLHLNMAADDRLAEVKRLVALGATEVNEIKMGTTPGRT
jgi:hypothetical protein